MAQPLAYLTAAEATTLITAEMLAVDPARVAFAALAADADRDIMLRRATEDIDAVVWRGKRSDESQGLAWPRIESDTLEIIDADPDADGSESVADLPRDFRRAVAAQAAHHAVREAGLDTSAHIEEATRRGMVSQSGGGQSQTYDLARATAAWARLCVRAQTLLSRWRYRGGRLI